MIRVPTARRRRKPLEKLNLTPIMDAVFIFIFFLLMSVNFVKMMEIGSDVPIVSESDPPPPDKEPLGLQVVLKDTGIEVSTGLSSPQVVAQIPRVGAGYDLDALHAKLVEIKRGNQQEEMVILTPEWEIGYEELIQVMDKVRLLEKTDEAFFKKDKDGVDVRVETLFPKIIFSNLMS